MSTWRGKEGGFVVNPICHWSDEDVWAFLRREKVPYCPLYDEGFKRLGCIGCPMAGQQRHVEFARWPVFKKMWMHGAELYWNKCRDRNFVNLSGDDYYVKRFKSAKEMFDWWLSDDPATADEEEQCLLGLW